MTLGTAKMINKISKVFLAASAAGLLLFFAAYMKGSVEFKYVSLPVMACFIGITWVGTSKMAVKVLEEDAKSEEKGS